MQHDSDPMSNAGLKALVSFLRETRYEFVTPTPATHNRINNRPAHRRAELLTDIFGWSRPFESAVLPASLFDVLKDGGVIREKDGGWISGVRASTLHRQTLLHSAFPTLSPDAVFFGPDTYRFANAIRSNLRAEPRTLQRALDIGCGTGAGAIVISKQATCDEILMTDINETALQFAALNADAAGVEAVPLNSDLFANVDGDFGLIVANPPYLNDPLQRAYRHGGGELGSALSVRIAEAAKDRLSPGGSLLLYTGSPIVAGRDLLLRAVEQCFAGSNLIWSYEEVDPDVFGEELETEAYSTVDRIAAVLLTARMPGVLEC
ncbi:class I SAM-dependent methyltransferase [Bradyrhizobium sp. JYMT SZCCT0428]|uniref:methyltransferase n=1 Tax=Bradyrhizobium sp. JYMT SZCCT0428 TaxID=2807673 RepID=UPI001BA62D64|nr:class I SAM-dependent methyltransferase [Bradyrhizobium sp. JYMT SZCCT0428]MBR1153587.1 class I SAM-dependent methyltransferase [Bradyrhizobium sp. JYMT SZCCT0428]